MQAKADRFVLRDQKGQLYTHKLELLPKPKRTLSPKQREKPNTLRRITVNDRSKQQVFVEKFSLGQSHVVAIDCRCRCLIQRPADCTAGVLAAMENSAVPCGSDLVSLKKEDYVDSATSINTRNLFENLDSDQMILQSEQQERKSPVVPAVVAAAGNQVSYLYADKTLMAFGNKYGDQNQYYPLVMNMSVVGHVFDRRRHR